MTSVQFYDPDAFYRPVPITGDNNQIAIREDPGGSNDLVQVSLPLPSTFTDGAFYYAVADDDAADGSIGASYSITTLDDLDVIPLYSHILRLLNANSVNGLTYNIRSTTPTGSSLTDSGLELLNITSTTPVAWDWSNSTISPRYLGFPRDTTGTSASSDVLASPIARWGNWQSPDHAAKKLKNLERTSFSTAQRASAPDFAWGELDRLRAHVYQEIASPHIYAFDRADRSTLADLAGLGADDHNNNLEDFWRLARIGQEQRILIKQNGGEGGLSWEPDIQTHNVATLHKKDTFDPEGDTESRWRVEQYDVRLTWALEPPALHTHVGNMYRH